jgi:single-strand DNA-binding protein
MLGMNKAYLIGFVGQDPEFRTAADGKPILRLSLAVPSVRSLDGLCWEETDWYRLILRGENAKSVARRARKGWTLAVECSLHPRDGGKDGVDVVVDRVIWLQPGSSRTPAMQPENP